MSQNIPSSLQLKIVTPGKLLVETEAEEVQLPGLDGYLGILPGHRPLVTILGEGEIIYRKNTEEEHFSVRGGYAEITPEKILVITELYEDGINQQAEG